jgi:hypothetical protein
MAQGLFNSLPILLKIEIQRSRVFLNGCFINADLACLSVGKHRHHLNMARSPPQPVCTHKRSGVRAAPLHQPNLVPLAGAERSKWRA